MRIVVASLTDYGPIAPTMILIFERKLCCANHNQVALNFVICKLQKMLTSVSETIRKTPLVEAQSALGNKNTFRGTRVSIPLPKLCEKLLPHAKLH